MQVLCPVVVGREVELARLEAVLVAAATGHGSVILLSGEAGTGKTRLGRELCAVAESRGSPVLAGRAVEEAPSPYRPLVEALGSAVRRHPERLQADELAPFRAALGRLVPEWGARVPMGAEAFGAVVGESLLRVLRHLGKGGGCLMVLEDLHWADPDTLAAVEYLADNLGTEPALVLVTLRSEEDGEAQVLVDRLRSRRSVEVLELGRLGAEATATMVQACLGSMELPHELAGLVWERSEGVPFLVEELLAALVASGALQSGTGGWVLAPSVRQLVPASFAAATRRRLASLGPPEARVLHAASLIGASFDWRLLPAMTGLADDVVLAALRRGIEAQLIQPQAEAGDASLPSFRFRHSLTAEALRGDLLPPERAAFARAALDFLEADDDRTGTSGELAAALAEVAGERERAFHHLLGSARHALSLGALASAESVLGRARTLATSPGALVEIEHLLLEALVLAGRSDDALEVGTTLIEHLAAMNETGGLLATHLHLARAATQAGRSVLADEHLRAGRRLAGRTAGVEDLARLSIEVGNAAILRADAHTAAAAARSALQECERPEIVCEASMLLGRALRTIDLAGAAAAFEQARATATGPRLALWRMQATHELGTIDLFTTNRQDRLLEARERAAAAGALGTLAAIDLHLGVAADTANVPEEALRRAASCTEVARRLGLSPLVAIGLGVQADIRAMGGPRSEVERLAGEVLAMADATPDARASAWGALARNSLCMEDHGRAAAELEQSVACVRDQARTTAPGPYFGFHALLAALRGTNGQAAVAEARALGADASGWNRGLLACAEAAAAGRDGHGDRAMELATQAERALSPYPGYGQLGLRLMAQAAVEDGWGQPERWLVPALRFAEQRRLAEVASACRALLRRAGVPVSRWRSGDPRPAELVDLGITAREVEVLRLVGEGCTNAEIARRLFISVRTVEKHVESLLRKTQLGRRTQLASRYARLDVGSSR